MRLVALLAQHLNAVVFTCGFVTVITSLAWWSGPIAGVTAGSTLMAIAVWPYVRPRKS